jgi:CDP-4-dehydro-6-deoxyglucose reductase
MALLAWRTGKVLKIENETANTRRFWIAVPELECFDFIPGQFITLDLPIHKKPHKRLRSYSIASCPDGSNIFELLIVLDSKGTGTPYLFEKIAVGSQLIFRGPQGVFTIKQPIETDLFLICTGTGIAPFRSMVKHIAIKNIAHKDIYLVFGCRTRADLLYYNEMTDLQKTLEGFHYLPTLSRENWEGRTGYVHSVYETLCTEKKQAVFYLCGWKNMIDEARAGLLSLGYDEKHIHTEIYG